MDLIRSSRQIRHGKLPLLVLKTLEYSLTRPYRSSIGQGTRAENLLTGVASAKEQERKICIAGVLAKSGVLAKNDHSSQNQKTLEIQNQTY